MNIDVPVCTFPLPGKGGVVYYYFFTIIIPIFKKNNLNYMNDSILERVITGVARRFRL